MYKSQCLQLRAEVSFLDETSYIDSGNRAERRWKYRALGDALVKKYQNCKWEAPKPGTKIELTRSAVHVSMS
ncbi:hypothetical protein V5799_017842 [Amblyomma americanum]|uniref:Uncharacterized protein n=1 Tax=Amblyomma americanum TaxID=6943 RepID=A0AAQ4F1L6_AMBAM